MHCSSLSLSIRLTSSSRSMTSRACSLSRLTSDSTASAICRSTSPPILSRPARKPRKSSSYCLLVCCGWVLSINLSPRSAESPGDIVFGFALGGVREDLLGLAILDKVAGVHEGCLVGASRGLLHVVRHDDDSVR